MTIYDISEKAGVSIATVSRVLNGSSRVSEKTRNKVLEVIRQYEYTPNVFARGLGLNTMRTIGIMCADSSDIYLAKAVYYIEQMLRSNDYNSILCCTGYSPEAKAASMNLLLGKKVDGIILAGSNFVYETESENEYIIHAAARIPIMLLNADLDVPNVYGILSDDYSDVYNATTYLLSTGVKHPLYFYDSTTHSGKRKLAGYTDAMKEQNRLFRPELLQLYQGSHEDLSAMTSHLKTLRNNGLYFDGVMAADDALALAAVKYGKLMGYSIPEDFSIMGYNNSLLAVCCDPELTSIDNRLENLCQTLIQTLLGCLRGEEMPRKTIFPGEMIKRGTTF